LNRLIRDVAKWKEMAGILGRKDAIKDADDKLEELKEIMQHLGGTTKSERPVAQKGEFHKSSS